MARTKRKSDTKKVDKKQRAEMLRDELRNRFSNLTISKSYTSLVYGIITLVVLFALGFAAVRLFTQNNTPEIQEGIESDVDQSENQYTVKEGETLWSIAEQEYNDGYAWSDIAEANELQDPNNLEAGTKLVLPERSESSDDTEVADQSTTPTQEPEQNDTPTPTEASQEEMQAAGERITGTEYTVVAGDTLWDISIRAYGNGYQWPNIARHNGITTPDLIYVGTKLSLQR